MGKASLELNQNGMRVVRSDFRELGLGGCRFRFIRLENETAKNQPIDKGPKSLGSLSMGLTDRYVSGA